MKKILLLTDIPPSTNFSGGIVLDQLCRFLPKHSIVCFCVLDASLKPKISKKLSWIPIQYAHRPRERWPVGPLKTGRAMSFLGEQLSQQVSSKKIIQEAVEFAKRHNVSCVWAILEGSTMIRISLPIAKKLNATLFSEVWDPPSWAIRQSNIDNFTRDKLLIQFTKTLKASASVATASWAMKKRYAKLYRTKTVAFLPSLPESLFLEPGRKSNNSKELIIGIAGQLYATDCWESLISTLDSVKWKILGRDVKIRLLGGYFNLSANSSVRIEYLGWRSQKETINILSTCDILYCPYWFNTAFEEEARLSFPSKLVSYFAAGRAVFFHGPRYASVNIFIREIDGGYCCNFLDTQAILNGLQILTKDTTRYNRYTTNGSQALRKYFTIEKLKKDFYIFLHDYITT